MQSLDPDHILTESAPSQQTVTSKAVNSSVPDWPLVGWIYNGCLCFKTYHYSIFAWVMSVSADLCLSTLFFLPKLALHCRRRKLQWRALWCLTLKSLYIPLRKSSTFWEIPLTICFLVRSYTGRLTSLSYKLNMKQLSEDELKQRQTASMAV